MTAFVAGRAGVVGKLRSQPEYLPVPSHAPAFAAFDAWLTTGVEWAARLTNPAWAQAFANGEMHGFVFRSSTDAADTALCGALAPSCDSAGRLFPLALGVPLQVAPELLSRPELLPFSLESLWAEATAALVDLMSERRPEILETPAPTAGQDADVAEAAQLYDDWIAALPLVDLWALLGPALKLPATTLRLLLEALAPMRGVEPATTTLSLRLPLGLAGGAALCFWLDTVRRYLGWQRTLPSLFWSHDGTSGAALLHLGRPPKAALAELWMPDGERDEIVDLTRAPDPLLTEEFAPLPPAVVATLGAPQATVAQLLSAFGA